MERPSLLWVRARIDFDELRSGGVFLDAACDDPERPVRERPLQLQRLAGRHCHPGFHLVGRRQDHGHRLRMNGADFRVRLRRQEGVEVVGRLAFFHLPDRRPVRPDTCEAGEGTSVIERKPDVAALRPVELAVGVERHDTAVLWSQPSCPVFALRVSDVGRAAVRLHPQQFLKVDRLGCGVARILVAVVEDFARAQGLLQIVLRVQKAPPAGVRLQRHLLRIRRCGHDRGCASSTTITARTDCAAPEMPVVAASPDLSTFAAAEAWTKVVGERDHVAMSMSPPSLAVAAAEGSGMMLRRHSPALD